MTVLMLIGGREEERHTSIASAKHCVPLLGESVVVHDVKAFDTPQDRDMLKAQCRNADVVFNNTHGGNCGNGVLQMALEEIGIPYTNSGPLTSAISLDKTLTCEHLAKFGITVPLGETMNGEQVLHWHTHRVRPPWMSGSYVVKQLDGGSSNGLFLIQGDEDLQTAKLCDGPMRVEEYVEGPEVTVAMLGSEVMGVVEFALPPMTVLDVARKFGNPETHCPARFDTKSLEEVSVRAGLAMGCRGAYRVDIRVRADGTPVVIETNTQPSLRVGSAYLQATRTKMTDKDLIKCLITDARVRGMS